MLVALLVLFGFKLTLWPNFYDKPWNTQQCSTHKWTSAQSQTVSSVSRVPFTQKEVLLPPSLSVSPGRLCNTVPSSSFLLTTKTLFYSVLFFLLSILRCLILHMILGQWEEGHIAPSLSHAAEIYELHTHWFCSYLVLLQCIAVVSLWPIGKGLLFYYYTKHSEDEIMFFVPRRPYLQN